jgi:hypothetical protein
MDDLSRRAILGGAVAAAASALWTAEPLRAQFVWQKGDWHSDEFEKVVHSTRKIKVALHTDTIGDGRLLRMPRNCLNGLHFGHGLPLDQIQIVLALNGKANLINYSDEIWQKYRLGEFAALKDPKTGQPAVRNIFYTKKDKYTSDDPSNDDSLYQDGSIQALQGRGIVFISCHTAVEEASAALVKQNNLSVTTEDVAKDLVAHALPGVIVVPALASAMAILQSIGNYGYMEA